MKETKREKLERSGWKVGGVKEFLGLSDEELRLIEMKRALMKKVREKRERRKLSQDALAKLINSSQSRVAKIEAASPDVSFDLILKALIALGVTRKELARTISSS